MLVLKNNAKGCTKKSAFFFLYNKPADATSESTLDFLLWWDEKKGLHAAEFSK